MEDFFRDEAARTLGLEYSVQPLHLSCAEPAKIVTTYNIISAMLCLDGGQYAMQSLFWAREDISVAAWPHRASNQQIKLADTI